MIVKRINGLLVMKAISKMDKNVGSEYRDVRIAPIEDSLARDAELAREDWNLLVAIFSMASSTKVS